MGLQELKNEIADAASFRARSKDDWEHYIRQRAVHVKFEEDIDHAVNCYVRKIPLLRKVVADGLDEDGVLQEKIDRILDKLACCEKEKELRIAGAVNRNPHHTEYYLDYANGDDANDGLSTGNAWKTLRQYSADTVRSAGDIGWMRANTTWLQGTDAEYIGWDEDGTRDSYISLIGCSSVSAYDPWGDADDTKPIIDFEDSVYVVYLNGDHYIKFERLDLQRFGNTGYGGIRSTAPDCEGIYVKDCKFSLGRASYLTRGIRFQGSKNFIVEGCDFVDCDYIGMQCEDGSGVIKNCTINAGSVDGCNFGLYASGAGEMHVIDTVIGSDAVAFGTKAIHVGTDGKITGIGVDCSGLSPTEMSDIARTETTEVQVGLASVSLDDWNGIGTSGFLNFMGYIQKETSIPRSGGSPSYAKMVPTTYCGPNSPLILGDLTTGWAPQWLQAGNYTITVYARTGSAWDTPLTAAECYLEAAYLDHATNATRTFIQSTETIANDTSWTAFTVSVSPAQEGLVLLWFKLAEYEDATEYIDVDVVPLVT